MLFNAFGVKKNKTPLAKSLNKISSSNLPELLIGGFENVNRSTSA